MKPGMRLRICLLLLFSGLFSSTAFCDSMYDRELIVQDKTRAMQVEAVFKEMIAAYENEDAYGFLEHVSDERFRQDYITFTDALYSDFRNYEIHRIDYWIDKVVPDNVKQFLFVRWEKRYENLDDGRQLTQRGVSRFLFDEVDGRYLLIELAGNNLFGDSLPEWRQEVPQIVGQVAVAAAGNDNSNPTQNLPDLVILDAKWEPNYSGAFEGTLAFAIRNIGMAASGPCDLGVELFTHVVTITVPALGPNGDFSSVRTNVTQPEVLKVDYYDVVTESNENNNTFVPTVRP